MKLWLLLMSVQCRDAEIVGNYSLYIGTLYLRVLHIGHVSFHPSGAYNFEVVPKYVGTLCTPGIVMTSDASYK